MTVLSGSELFTGNAAIVAMAHLQRKASNEAPKASSLV